MRIFIFASGIFLTSMVAYCQQPNPAPRAQIVSPKQQAVEEIPKVTAEKTMSFWMAKKLEYSKSMLESLTKGDFEKLAKDAEQMKRLGKIEGLVRSTNNDYKTQLHTFELANQEVVRQSKRRNAEGSTLAFNQLTTSCVACHTLLREGIE